MTVYPEMPGGDKPGTVPDAVPEAWEGEEKLSAPDDFASYQTVYYWLNSYQHLKRRADSIRDDAREELGAASARGDGSAEAAYQNWRESWDQRDATAVVNEVTWMEGVTRHTEHIADGITAVCAEIDSLMPEAYPGEDAIGLQEIQDRLYQSITRAHSEQSFVLYEDAELSEEQTQEAGVDAAIEPSYGGSFEWDRNRFPRQLRSSVDGTPIFKTNIHLHALSFLLVAIEMRDRLKEIKAERAQQAAGAHLASVNAKAPEEQADDDRAAEKALEGLEDAE